MRHVFYRPIYGTVPRAYYGMFCVCFLRISRELWVAVNRSVVVKLSNQVNTSWVNKEAWCSLFHVFVKDKYEKVVLAWPGPLIILGFSLSKNPHFTSTCLSYFQVTTTPYLLNIWWKAFQTDSARRTHVNEQTILFCVNIEGSML